MEKEKKQFRLFDVYRQSFTGTSSRIRGINSYKVSKYFEYFDETKISTIEISIDYSNGSAIEFIANNEDELKEVIKKVNKELKNCRKPGRKIKKY